MSPSVPLPPHLVVEATLVADKSYRVRDLRTGAPHVLRLCREPKALVQRRIDLLAAKAAPALVLEREFVEAGGRFFTLRPWVEGRPVVLRESDLAPLVELVAVALEPLHVAGIAHGRLHVGNVIRAADGRLFLVDAVDALPGLDATGALHAAPEQLRGEAPDVRADVYAAGLLAFEACTDRRPLAGASWVELARRALYDGVDFTFDEASRLEAGAVASVRRALALEPKARCASLRELADGLRPTAAPQQVPARTEPLLATQPAPVPAPVEVRSPRPASPPALAIPPGRRRVAEALGRVAAAARSRVTPRRMALAGATLAVVGAAAAVVLHLAAGGGLEREVAKLIEQNEYRQASAVLAAARREGAQPALVDKLEGDLACAQGGHAACLGHYARALEQDPDLASDDTLRTNTLAAFDHADRRWLVAKVAAKLDGVDDTLLRHASDTRYWVRWNAVRALEERGLKDRIPYGAVYGLDVLHAATCSTRERSLRKVVEAGAVEARPYLLEAKAKTDGKLFGDWCLGSDLDAAIRRLDRAAPKSPQKM